MEVTRKNFTDSLHLIRESINKADFLVIDTEFTGLMDGREISVFNTPGEYYATLLKGSSEFLLIQYGLCAFYWDEELQQYKNHAYNFYLFPRGRPGLDRLFLCQGSSLDFLASQGFDFNKLIREGISFMTEPDETRLREALREKQKISNQDRDHITIPEEHKKYIDQVCERVRNFLDKNQANEMSVDRCNNFVRRLLYQELKERFRDEIYLETVILENKDRVLKVFRLTKETTENNRTELKKQKEWEEFEEDVGFSKVARMISESGKLVIGHNMLLDLMHTLNHFFQPLKGMDYAAFKEFAHCMFPKLLDTKYMSSLPPLKDKVNSSVLKHLFQTLSEAPFSMPNVESDEGRGYTRCADKQHEAGYDAYVTGLCFLAMSAHVSPAGRCDINGSQLVPYLNKLFLARTAPHDSPYLNLVGDDPSPSRDHVFHLTFPREWQRHTISDLFNPFGPVTVQFLGDTTAIVQLSKRENSRYVLRAFDESSHVKVMPFSKYKMFIQMSPYQAQIERLQQELAKSKTMMMVEARNILNSTAKDRQVTSRTPKTLKPPPSPEKVPRVRSSSLSLESKAVPSPAVNRKRTSSGVFQIDEVEPPLKKDKESEKTKKNNTKEKNQEKIEKVDKIKFKRIEKEVTVTKFVSDSKSKCVTAFKESDSWD
ncbi:poly(A)-specific ribonuclease PARN-like [Epargyreus clarus]|uniref:poly(A)-specific ribonuclease PARN-like n=1 Tax=Epargyreus clarus TaxID=520877 RepID=UPI003C2FE162